MAFKELWLQVQQINARQRQFIAFGLVLGIELLLGKRYPTDTLIILGWLTYSGSLLLLMWLTMTTSHPSRVRKIASLQDYGFSFLFLFVVAAAFINVFVMVLLLHLARLGTRGGMGSNLLISILSVISSWWLVHTVFALRYAHIYYSPGNHNKVSGKNALEFPGEPEPDYLDFAYFAFVVGMTFQVSDVQVVSRRVRRLVLLHGIISFVFNTVLLALSINLVLGIAQR